MADGVGITGTIDSPVDQFIQKSESIEVHLSVSLRDLFAAFALAGVMLGKDAGETNPRWAAAKAYDLASAMLDQRAENQR